MTSFSAGEAIEQYQLENDQLREQIEKLEKERKQIYGFLESTCPDGFADEVFRKNPTNEGTQIVSSNLSESNQTGECARPSRQDSSDRREDQNLNEQVEKLTKEREEYREQMYDVGACAAEFLTRAERAEQQLAALAEQNEKMRAFLEFAWKDIPMSEYAFEILEHAMNLPDLATPALNRISAEVFLEAADIAGPEDSHQDEWFKAKADSCAKLRAKADELENSNG